ncbi:MAG: 3-oxoacyl-[acyl-carrier-protein] synthase III C-terminal domain-containing protein [Mycobacterium sp.]
MAYLSVVSAYVPDGTDADGRPRHLTTAVSEMSSVHDMVEAASRQIDSSLLAAAADSLAASFHCGTLYQGEHLWPMHNSLQRSVLGRESAGAAAEIRQFCSGGLFGVMLADAVLEAGWSGDYAMVTGGDSIFYFDRYEYAASPVVEGSLLGDNAFCAILSKNDGFARILSGAARSHNASADAMRSRADHGLDDPVFPDLARYLARFEGHNARDPEAAARNAMASFRSAIATVIECYERVGIDPSEIDVFAPCFIEPSYVTELIAKQSQLKPNPALHEFGTRFGHLTVSDFCVNLAYLMNNKIAKVGDLVMLFSAGNFVNSAAVLVRIEKDATLPINVSVEPTTTEENHD